MNWFWKIFTKRFSRQQQSISSIKIVIDLFEDQTYLVNYEFPEDMTKEQINNHKSTLKELFESINNGSILALFAMPLLSNHIENELFNYSKNLVALLSMNKLSKDINKGDYFD